MRTKKSFRLEVLPLLAALAANAAAQAFLLVLLPSLGRDLGFDALETGLLLSSAALFLVLFAPAWGKISERAGRKPVLLIGLAGAALGPLLIAIVISFRIDEALDRIPALILLFAARAAQSMLSAGLLPAAQAWMADRTAPENRAKGMGLLGASYGIGGILGAGLAFVVGGTHPLVALVSLAMLVLFGFGLVFAKVTDRTTSAMAQSLPYPHLDMRRIAPGLAITLIGVCVYAIMQHVTALRLEDSMDLSRPDAISSGGAALMGAAIVMALTQTFGIGKLRRPPHHLIRIGAAAGVLSLAGVTLATTPAALFASLLVLGGALGILLPGNLALISIKAGMNAQGRAAGVNAVAQGLAMAAGPVAGAALHRLSPLAPGAASVILMLAALIIGLGVREKS